MVLSWNEIKSRAIQFSNEWADTTSEEGNAQPFLVDFFNVFGISRKRFSTFEYKVKKLDDSDGYIDLLWKGILLIEMKSRGKSLDKAFNQAKDYLHGLKEHELPKLILVSDFEKFRLYDLELNENYEFNLSELVDNVHRFEYLLGIPKRDYKEQLPANVKAAELMGKLHDRLKEIGYEGHPLEVYLVRVLFCLFAEDTTIFQRQQFQNLIENRTNLDGSDLASKLQELFQVLNTPEDSRFKNLDEDLADFPYVNGKLFEESLPIASFDRKMRDTLLECCYLDWSKISPAIFGSMFQSVMNPKERRNLGAHYTSEENILKLIKPLFLDDLWKEFESLKSNNNKLSEFHRKISKLKFLDPACGCGNFLIITYKELRLLELEILRYQYKNKLVTSIDSIVWLDVDMMYGIEYEEFPARIAEVAMWLIDHQMNMLISSEFGKYFVRLPLRKSAKIYNGNALQMDWDILLNPQNSNYDFITDKLTVTVGEPIVHYSAISVKTNELEKKKAKPNPKSSNKVDYIIGNPPFIGSKMMTTTNRNDLLKEFGNIKGAGVLDYVSAWYVKASKYIKGTNIKVAFVSTNSITQGEQVGILWSYLLSKYGIKIHFAHRTFQWSNEAKGNAAVYCVIIGFANYDTNEKRLFLYDTVKSKPNEVKVNNINPYLVDAKDILISKRSNPICNVPRIVFGSMPNDGGNFLFSDEEKETFLLKEPNANNYFKPIISSYEFLNGKTRWCLWLKDIMPNEIRALPHILKIVENVKEYRLKSTRLTTRKLAEFPSLFGEIRQPEGKFILIPRVSSEHRKYIPMGFFDSNVIVSDSCLSVNSEATIFHFGLLQSAIHLVWVKMVCGRLKSDFRYSNEIVYNNFPWPENPTEKQIKLIEDKAQKVLDVRKEFANSSLADLYDPLSMPPALLKAHNELDKAVDLAYRPQPFTNDANRMEFLFELYEKYTANLFTKEKVKKKRK